MPYKLRKARNRDLYWVVAVETGKKFSEEPMPLEKAEAQMRVLESAMKKREVILTDGYRDSSFFFG